MYLKNLNALYVDMQQKDAAPTVKQRWIVCIRWQT